MFCRTILLPGPKVATGVQKRHSDPTVSMNILLGGADGRLSGSEKIIVAWSPKFCFQSARSSLDGVGKDVVVACSAILYLWLVQAVHSSLQPLCWAVSRVLSCNESLKHLKMRMRGSLVQTFCSSFPNYQAESRQGVQGGGSTLELFVFKPVISIC